MEQIKQRSALIPDAEFLQAMNLKHGFVDRDSRDSGSRSGQRSDSGTSCNLMPAGSDFGARARRLDIKTGSGELRFITIRTDK